MQNLQKEADLARDYLEKIATLAEKKFDEHLPPETDIPCNSVSYTHLTLPTICSV